MSHHPHALDPVSHCVDSDCDISLDYVDDNKANATAAMVNNSVSGKPMVLFPMFPGETGFEDLCSYEVGDNLHIRFPLIITVICLTGTVGVIGNMVSIYIFTRKEMQNSSSWFLILLAACDLGLVLMSFFVCAVEVTYDYLQSLGLYRLWLSYIREAYLFSHICQAGAVYATVAATLERWAFLGGAVSTRTRLQSLFCSNARLAVTTSLLITFVIGAQLPKYFEASVVEFESCEGFERFALVPSSLLANDVYVLLYSTLLNSVAFVLLPFGVILLLNVAIILRMLRKPTAARTPAYLKPWVSKISERMQRRRIRQAAVVIVPVSFVFLVCSLPNVILTILEQVATQLLDQHRTAYGFSRDAVNLLSVVNASANFVIYVTCARDYREQLGRILKTVCATLGYNNKKSGTMPTADSSMVINPCNNANCRVTGDETGMPLAPDDMI